MASQPFVTLPLGRETIRGDWGGNDCLRYIFTVPGVSKHLTIRLASSGLDPEVTILDSTDAVVAHNDNTREGSGRDSLLGKTLERGDYTIRVGINRTPSPGSGYRLTIDTALRIAHAGHHQGDASFEYTGPTTTGTGAVPLPAWAATVVEDEAAKWEAASNGLVEICERGTCAHSDGSVTAIEVVEGSDRNLAKATIGGDDCGRTIACVMYYEPPGSGHIGAITFRIENPPFMRDTLVNWTDNHSEHNMAVGGVIQRYLPSTVLHELGHTLGLDDLRDPPVPRYVGMVMHTAGGNRVLTDRDRAYLLQVYRDHISH